MTKQDELVEAQKEYIELLGKENSSLLALAWVHGWRPNDEDVKRAGELRKIMDRLEGELK